MPANKQKLVNWLNRMPLNQAALKALKKAGEKVDYSLLHAHQLMLWAVNTGEFDLDSRLEATVEAFSLGDPKDTMKVLEGKDEGGGSALPGLLEDKDKPPLRFAWSLLDQVWSRMVASGRPDL